MKLVSTSALAKLRNQQPKELFSEFERLNLIVRDEKSWALTPKGKEKGGEYKESKLYGTYIAWPENVELAETKAQPATTLLTATSIGKNLGLSSVKVNAVLSEIGWISKALKGWKITSQGIKQGGTQSENYQSGVPYVTWPESILQSSTLLRTAGELKGEKSSSDDSEESSPEKASGNSFREKFPATHRSTDGHMVRSKAEMLIDNWLYMAEIVHAYERKLPIEENVYSDFYIPTGKVYIEYWGYENDQRYLDRKKAKLEIYSKYGFNLIELNDSEVQNLDDILPRLLLKFGVQAY